MNIHSFLKILGGSTNNKQDGAEFGCYSEKRAGPYIYNLKGESKNTGN